MDFLISILIVAIFYLNEFRLQIDGDDYIKYKKHFAFIKKNSEE